MSLRVLINDKEAALSEEVEVVLKLQNTFYEDRKEDATIPFKLDLVSNRHIFDFAERINNTININFSAKIYFGPYQILMGRGMITDVDNTNVELFMSTDKQSFWGRAKNCNLNDLSLGEERFTSKDLMLKGFTESLTKDYDYVVCPLIDTYLPNIGVALRHPVYNFIEVGNGNSFKEKYQENNNIFCPFIRLKSLIRKVVEGMGYRLLSNVLDSNDVFKDIILICRRRAGSAETYGAAFQYNQHVPMILVSDFIKEIENKFGVVFHVNDGNRTVSINGNNGVSDVLEISVLDGVKKHIIDENDKIKGVKFCDQDIDDAYVNGAELANELTYLYGSEYDAKTIECISNIVGTKKETFYIPDSWTGGEIKAQCYCAIVEANYADRNAYNDAINKEFRLSVYRGYSKRFISVSNYPLADYKPYLDAYIEEKNKSSLAWTGVAGLFYTYHKKQIDMKMNLQQEDEFTLARDITRLKDLQQIFKSELIIRNRKYRCFEQEIKFSKKAIVSHVLRCYPV